ncbi:MAG: YggS family pyridoxal phosphate-dependent enzyme [Bacteroidota bacterium]
MVNLKSLNTVLQKNNAILVAVSKTQSNERILDIYNSGQRVFGENRVQELAQKYEELPKDIQWHLIGHLQRNKVKYIASFVKLIHSVDSFQLLKEINKQAKKHDRIIECLLQIRIADEATKFGLTPEAVEDLLQAPDFKDFNNVRIIGLMGMATFTYEKTQVRQEFKRLKSLFDLLKTKYFEEASWFKEISMGMSGDYEIALEEGSTIVRIGSLIFGHRQ